jgi:hypothetical protein
MSNPISGVQQITSVGFLGQKFEYMNAMDMSGGKYVIYALLIGIAITVAVLIIDVFFPFLPTSPLGPSSQARAGKTFWKSADAGADENLIVPASASPTKAASVYSMSVQFVVGDSRAPNPGKFRHIVHRGSNPCGITAADGKPGSSGHAGIRASDLPDTDPSYKSLGLPAIMNPGLMLDQYKNDLHVFVHTKGAEEGKDVLWLESITVADLPLHTPITVGVICNGKQLEVYLNCRLYSTTLLKGTPYLPKADNQWFGRYCAYPLSGMVKNLTLWPTALNSTDFIKMCRNPTFNMADLPATCTAAGSSCPDTSLIGSLRSAVSGQGLQKSQKETLITGAASMLL